MRSLSQCRDEIFERSEKRIRRRKRKMQIAACTAPLCLCVVLLMLPGMRNSGSVESSIENGYADGVAGVKPESVPEQQAIIESEDGIYLLPPEEAEKLSALLEGFFREGSGAEAQTPGEVFRIELPPTFEKGEWTGYLLQGNCLEQEGTSRRILLSQPQMEKLLRVMDEVLP